MRLVPTLFGMLCSLICVSNGAPPRHVNTKSNVGALYTEEEDQFIVNQLLNIIDHTTKPQSRTVWETIAKEHYEKRIQGITGFSHERSAESLRHRFLRVLLYNKPDVKVKVPEVLINKFMESEVIRYLYTKEEDDFIIKELSKPSYPCVFSQPTYEALREKHGIKRTAGTAGFEHDRTEGGLRNHLVTMKNAGKLPKEILEKIHAHKKGASSSRPTTSNQQTGLRVRNEGQCDDNLIADMIEGLQNTDYEIDFSMLQ